MSSLREAAGRASRLRHAILIALLSLLATTLAGPVGAGSATHVGVLCTSHDVVCDATDASGLTRVTTTAPPVGGTMALTFGGAGGTFTCGGTTRPVIGSQATIDPRGYTKPIEATFMWDKSITGGTGVAHFVFCLSKDNGSTFFVVPACGRKVGPTCEVERNRSGAGHLRIVVRLAPEDPVGSLG